MPLSYPKTVSMGEVEMAVSKGKKFILGYLVFVALPAAGLVVCLKYGFDMKAQASVDGVWRIRSSSMQAVQMPCLTADFAGRETPVTISQSGKFLSLRSNSGPEVSATGTIEERTITLSARLPTAQGKGPGCEPYQRLNVTATLAPGTRPANLTGILSADGCASCASISFEAIRLDSGSERTN
jgi:hypothetical protein